METHEERIHEVLRRWWGFDSFRPVQEQIVRAAMEGRDTLALMPTGGGKSLTYQVPTMAREGLCIVVTPLIALMKDQVDRLRARRIPAVAIHSGLSPRQIDIALDNCVYGDVKFLYVAPERLATEAFRLRVVRMNVSLLAVDEAHCISQWGYDFRPSYLRIAELRERLPGVPVLALTASATKPVAEDIMRHLRFAEPHILRSSFARPNLSYSVRRTDDKQGQLLRLVQNVPGSGIVYMRTREGTEQVADMLRRQGVAAAAYHGGLGHAERALRQEEWLADKVRVMVATNAFGMGIDKPDVRFVAHLDLPKNVEGYYQETGRAGRDGDPAHCLLLYSAADMAQLLYFARQTEDEEQRSIAEKHAYAMLEYAERNQCRRKALLSYFGEDFEEPNCGGCDVCTGEIQEEDYTIEAQKALSAMVRSGCRFGRVLIMDILMGADNRRIRETGFQHLPTYGVGKDRTRRFWKYLIDALTRQGLAAIEGEEYPYLRVTETGWETLRGAPFRALRIVETRARRNRAERDGASQDMDVDDTLFQLLRAERRRLAEAAQVPPYVVFHDRALREMAAGKPASREAMLGIAGVGERKLAQYGDAFLAVIARYISEN